MLHFPVFVSSGLSFVKAGKNWKNKCFSMKHRRGIFGVTERESLSLVRGQRSGRRRLLSGGASPHPQVDLLIRQRS